MIGADKTTLGSQFDGFTVVGISLRNRQDFNDGLVLLLKNEQLDFRVATKYSALSDALTDVMDFPFNKEMNRTQRITAEDEFINRIFW